MLEKDITIGLPEHGLRLAFDPVEQRLRLIEVVDADRLTVILRGRRLFGGAAMPPRLGEVYGALGPTYLAEERESGDGDEALAAPSFPLLYPGLLFLFPQQQHREGSSRAGSSRSSPLPEGPFCADAVARRVVVFAGVATSVAGALRAPAPLSLNDKSHHPRLKHACWFAVAGRGIYGLGCEHDAALELGCSVQSVLTVLGPPESCSPSRGLAAEQGRYALTYPRLGLDVVVHARRHTVSRLVLHGNLPGSPVFGLVERCAVRVLPFDAALWKDDGDGAKEEEVMGGGTNREGGDEEAVVPLPMSTGHPTVPAPIAPPPPEVVLGKKKGRKNRARGASSTASSTAPSYAASSSSLSSGIPSLSSSPGLSTPSPLHDAPALRQAVSRLGNGGSSTSTSTQQQLHEKRRGGSNVDADSVRGPSEGWSDADDLLPLVLESQQATTTASIGVQADEDGLTMMVGALELDDEENDTSMWDGTVSAFVVPEDVDLAGPGAEAGFERVPLQRDCATQTQRRRLGKFGIMHQEGGLRAYPNGLVSSLCDVDVLATQPGVSMADTIARVRDVFGPRRAARGGPLALSGPSGADATTLLYAYRGAVFETLPTGQLSSITLFRP